MLESRSWVIYEIMGHKVGICYEANYPRRPAIQCRKIHALGRTALAIEGEHFRKVAELYGTKPEAMTQELGWQNRLGYEPDLKGAKKSTAHARKIREMAQRTSRARRRPVLANGDVFPTAKIAGRELGVTEGAIRHRIKRGFPGYGFIDELLARWPDTLD